MTMTTNQIKAIKALEKAQGHITDAIELLEKARKLEPCINSYAEYYTIPWLRNFRNNNTNQTGNIEELIQSIKKEAGIDE